MIEGKYDDVLLSFSHICTSPRESLYFLGADLEMEYDPRFRWKVSPPVNSMDDQIMFLKPARLRVCIQLFLLLAYFAKASLLIDYSHFECTL